MPPAAVETLTIAARPVDATSEFVGTVKSRRSTTIQPQVEGFVTGILVKPGDRVTAGTPLFTIDATPQQAALASLHSIRAGREADVALARQNAERAKTLIDVGAISRQEYDQILTTEKSTQAQLAALGEQIRQVTAELAYYRLLAPTAGVVGDIPIRQGDRVTRATALTTVDDTGALEVYVGIPVSDAPRAKVGLPVRLLDDAGEVVTTERVDFIAPAVDNSTQTVLVKAPIRASSSRFRANQFVRAQVVFGSEPGITIPLVSVMRINAQHFVYVVERTGQAAVAKQRAVTVGDVIGNDYVVTSGLRVGEELVVSGVQKIGDGMPVAPQPAKGA